MVSYLKRLSVGIGAALTLCVMWVPVTAEAATHHVAPVGKTGSGTYAQLQEAIAALPAPSAAQLAAALAVAKAHPMQGGVTALPAPSKIGPDASIGPDVSVSGNWWGVRIYLSNGDLHNIISLIIVGGIGGAATIMCAPGVWLALACGLVGGAVGYVVAEVVWNVIGANGGCGTNIDIPWSLNWHTWGC